MSEENTRTVNGQIEQIGLNVTRGRGIGVLVIFDVADGCGCSITVPVDRASEFLEIFKNDDGIDLDGGTYVESLKGKYVRLTFDSMEPFQGKLVEVGHIVDDEWYLVNT